MIKPSTPTFAAPRATRPAQASEDTSRPVAREGDTREFSNVMAGQRSRDDIDCCRDETGAREQAREADEPGSSTAGIPPASAEAPASGAATSAVTSTTTPAAPGDVAATAVDPMLGLCTSPPPETGMLAGRSLNPGRTEGEATGSASRELDTAGMVGAGDARANRALLDGELLKRLALGAAAFPVPATAESPTSADGSSAGSEVCSAADAAGVGTTSGIGEGRPIARANASQPAGAPAAALELRSPLGSGAWRDELGARVTWMVDRGDHVASLRLSPENLGPLEVRIAVREGETSVWFGAASAETRAALEQSLPRLKELLGAAGLSLADAGVFGHAPQDPRRGFTAAALARASQESGVDSAGSIVMQVSRRGLVDLYA